MKSVAPELSGRPWVTRRFGVKTKSGDSKSCQQEGSWGNFSEPLVAPTWRFSRRSDSVRPEIPNLVAWAMRSLGNHLIEIEGDIGLFALWNRFQYFTVLIYGRAQCV